MNMNRMYRNIKAQLEEYNEIISDYYNERTKGERKDSWTEQMVGMLSQPKKNVHE